MTSGQNASINVALGRNELIEPLTNAFLILFIDS